MILVYLSGDKEIPSLEYDSLENIEENLIKFFYDFNKIFREVVKLTDEDDNIIRYDLNNLNLEVEEGLTSLEQESREWQEELNFLRTDYLRSVL